MQQFSVVFLVTAFLFSVAACGPAGVKTIQHSGNSVNYEFESSKEVDEETGECKRIEIDVYAKSKLYTNAKKPPQRLTVVDADCRVPFEPERARYVGDEEGAKVVSGSELDVFKRDYEDLFHELYGFVSTEVGMTGNP